jgi:hypothetical protein
MIPDDIKRGHFYRFKGSNTVFLILFEWPADADHGREVEYIALHHNGPADETRRQTVEQIAQWCSCEVRARWMDVDHCRPGHEGDLAEERATLEDAGVPASGAGICPSENEGPVMDPFLAGLGV